MSTGSNKKNWPSGGEGPLGHAHKGDSLGLGRMTLVAVAAAIAIPATLFGFGGATSAAAEEVKFDEGDIFDALGSEMIETGETLNAPADNDNVCCGTH